MTKKSPVFWMLGRIKRYIPALLLLTAVHIVFALFGVWFALGTKEIVDSAVSGSGAEFRVACMKQAAIIGGLLLGLFLQHHLRDWLLAELDRRWKKHLFGVLLQGEYAAVSAYHSGELLNRLNNDVRVMNEGMISALPHFADLVTRLVAALAVLIGLVDAGGNRVASKEAEKSAQVRKRSGRTYAGVFAGDLGEAAFGAGHGCRERNGAERGQTVTGTLLRPAKAKKLGVGGEYRSKCVLLRSRFYRDFLVCVGVAAGNHVLR